MKSKKTIKNKIVIGLLGVFALSVCVATANLNSTSVKADVATIVDYSDRFDSKEISNSWTLLKDSDADVEFLDVEHHGMIFNADFDTYSTQVVYRDYKMTGDCTVEFVTLCEDINNGWLAFSAGNKSTANGMPYASAAFIMAPAYSSIFADAGGVIQPVAGINITYSPTMSKYHGQLLKTTYDFKKTGEANNYDITYTVKRMDGELVGSYVYEDFPIIDGYFGLNAEYCDLAVVSFKVYESAEEKVNCDFTQSSMLYPTTGLQTSDWQAVSGFDSNSVKIGVIANLDVSNEGTSVVYKTKYVRPIARELEALYTLTADVKTVGMGVGVATGFEIGKSEVEERGIFAGLTKDENGEYYLVSFDGLNKTTVQIDETYIDGMTMKLVVYYDNTAILSLGGTSLKIDCRTAEGYVALSTLDFYDVFEGERGAKLDNFTYTHNVYKNEQASDLAINFNGTKTTYVPSIDDYDTEYYINKQDWRIATNVRIPTYIEGTENSAVRFYQNSSYFGPKNKYTNFIVRFDVTFLKETTIYDAPTFGLQFGMDKMTSPVAESNYLALQSSGLRSFIISEGGKLTATNAGKAPLCSDPHGQNQMNIFNQGETYNVMYVAQNGTVRLYLKEASQSDSVFEILRGEVKGVNTYGYLQLLTMYNATFNLDNFSVTNLDYTMTSSAYNGNGLEILRSDFRTGDKLENFTLNNAEYKDNSLLIKNGGSILSNSTIKNNIVRFKTKATDGNIVFEQGELKIKIAPTGDEIVAIHNNKLRKFSLDEKIDFDGALFEIYKMGNSVVIGYVNQNEPTSCIRHYQFEVVADNLFEDKIKLYSGEGALELYAVSVFDLKPNMTIATRNYDAAVDYKDPWTKRPTLQSQNAGEETSGCGASIESFTVVLPMAVALALVFVLRRRKDEKKN